MSKVLKPKSYDTIRVVCSLLSSDKPLQSFSCLICFTSSPDVLWVDPPAQQVDLSFLSDANNEYFLQVTAVIGENKSESVPHEGIIFSYFKDSPGPATQKCK